MKSTKKIRLIALSQVVLMIMTLVVLAIPTMVLADEHTVNLGSASTFGILAGSAITNTGPTTVKGTAGGSIGLHPGDDPTLVTFEGQTDVTLTGGVYLSDAVAEQAKVDLLAAYLDAKSRDTDFPIVDDLGGKTLQPGVYTSGSSIGITGTLTLDGDGDPNAVFIFQADSTLTTAAENSEIILINGAQPCNVFWQVGSSATLGTNTLFVGHILAMASITATTGAEVHGQLLALDYAVTLDSNVITNDACLAVGSLRVTKEVEGSVDDLTLVPFEITVSGPNYTNTQLIEAGEFYTWDLTEGLYTVSESALGQEWEVHGLGEYSVVVGEMRLVTVRNVYTASAVITLGSLTVTKVVMGDVGDLELSLFEITLSGQGFTSMVKLADGESHTWLNLTFGTYTITENKTLLGSEWTIRGEGTVEITSVQTVLRTITNEFEEEEVVVIVEPKIPVTGDSATLLLSGLFMLGFGLLILVKVKPSDK